MPEPTKVLSARVLVRLIRLAKQRALDMEQPLQTVVTAALATYLLKNKWGKDADRQK